MERRLNAALLALLGLAATGLGGCASHVKGSWACAMEPGVVCGSITDIDRGGPAKAGKAQTSADPVIEGAIPARLWGQGGWTAGSIAGAPVREPDPILKVALAPWVDGEGDYHAGAEIYAVMRHGSWFVAPKETSRRVDLARLAGPDPAADSAKGVAGAAASLAPPAPTHPDKR